jgi:hypothetical protein
MKHCTLGLLIGSLVLGGIVIPAEARGRHYRHHGRDDAHHVYRHLHPKFHHGYHHGYYAGGFLAGAATVLAVGALHTPRVVYQPVYYAGVSRSLGPRAVGGSDPDAKQLHVLLSTLGTRALAAALRLMTHGQTARAPLRRWPLPRERSK